METPGTTPTPESTPAQPKKSNMGLIIGIVVVVLLCCCCILAIAGYYLYSTQMIKGTSLLLNLL